MTNEIFNFKTHPENETGRLAPELFFLFKKVLCEVKTA